MQKKPVLKGLLAVSAAAAMFGVFSVHAQTGGMTQGGSSAAHDQAAGSADTKGKAGSTGSTDAKTLGKADRRALADMAMANMAEIEVGKLAQSKSQNPEVKTFAQQMIDDHGKALSEVRALAQSKDVILPTELDAMHKKTIDKLEKLSGDAFDPAYLKQAGVSEHKKTLAMLKKHQKSAKDPEVKALAGKMLPTVEQHLKAVQQIPAEKTGTASGK